MGLPANLSSSTWSISQQWNILGNSVSSCTTSPHFADWLSSLMRSFSATDTNAERTSLQFRIVGEYLSPTTASGSPTFQVYCNEAHVGEGTEYWQLLRLMEWQLDIFLSENTTEQALLHSGAVARDGQALLLIGESGAGKSSSSLALFLEGYRYLSDELAVIDLLNGSVSGFVKAFSLKDPGLFPILDLYAEHMLGPDGRQNRESMTPVWYVHPLDIRPDSVQVSSVPIRYLVFPQYDPARAPALDPISPEKAMTLLIENYVNTRTLRTGGLARLAQLVRETPAYCLTTPGVEETVALVETLDWSIVES